MHSLASVARARRPSIQSTVINRFDGYFPLACRAHVAPQQLNRPCRVKRAKRRTNVLLIFCFAADSTAAVVLKASTPAFDATDSAGKKLTAHKPLCSGIWGLGAERRWNVLMQMRQSLFKRRLTSVPSAPSSASPFSFVCDLFDLGVRKPKPLLWAKYD